MRSKKVTSKDKIISDLKDAIYLYESILAKLPTNVYWKDVNSVYMGCNDRLANSMGLPSRHSIIGMTDFDFNWKSAKSFVDFDKKVMETGKSLSTEDVFNEASGKEVTVLTNKTPLKNSQGKTIGVLAISVDITERKKMELDLIKAKDRAEEALIAMATAEDSALLARAKAQSEEEMRKTVMVLVGDIVHDLRTPIATIRTASDILSSILPALVKIIEDSHLEISSCISKKKWEYLKEGTAISSLQNSIFMIDSFIKATLDELANAQSIHQNDLSQFKLTLCSSCRILDNVLEAYPFPKNIVVHQNTGYEFFFMGNSILMMKVLFNLIKNSIEQIELMKRGEITISTESSLNENILKIKDTAGGASAEMMNNFFQEYFTTKKTGTGIGLAFCKKTVKIFGGDLTCHSLFGDYIEFVLSFPKL